MLKKVLILGAVAGVALVFSGCATIMSGKTQKINLKSKKEYVVTIDGRDYTSPGVIEVDRPDKDAILNVKECNKDILLKKEVNPTFFVNIILGGAFGSTTDYATKSMWQYEQTNVDVDCE